MTNDKANDFLAAARRQQDSGQSRPHYETFGFTQNQRWQERLQARLQCEIGGILATLSGLSADHNGRQFIVKYIPGLYDGLTLDCHYATLDEAQAGFKKTPHETPAFSVHITFSMDEGDDFDICYVEGDLPRLSISDHSRKKPNPFYNPKNVNSDKLQATYDIAKSWDHLRTLVGACVARLAPHRLEDIAAALNAPTAGASDAPTATTLSKPITLRAPQLKLSAKAKQPVKKKPD